MAPHPLLTPIYYAETGESASGECLLQYLYFGIFFNTGMRPNVLVSFKTLKHECLLNTVPQLFPTWTLFFLCTVVPWKFSIWPRQVSCWGESTQTLSRPWSILPIMLFHQSARPRWEMAQVDLFWIHDLEEDTQPPCGHEKNIRPILLWTF